MYSIHIYIIIYIIFAIIGESTVNCVKENDQYLWQQVCTVFRYPAVGIPSDKNMSKPRTAQPSLLPPSVSQPTCKSKREPISNKPDPRRTGACFQQGAQVQFHLDVQAHHWALASKPFPFHYCQIWWHSEWATKPSKREGIDNCHERPAKEWSLCETYVQPWLGKAWREGQLGQHDSRSNL